MFSKIKAKFSSHKKPEIYRKWTTVYYGDRGSGKTLHQAKVVLQCFKYWDWLYSKPKNWNLKRAMVYSIQKFSPEIEKKYSVWVYGSKKETKKDGSQHEVIDFEKRKLNNPAGCLYYWNDAKDLQYCPRIACWRGKRKHRLHGCILVIDDCATIFPAKDWAKTPNWLIKTFAQGRHFGIRILANMQDVESTSIHFKRTIDVVYKFVKLFSSRDPDETQPKIKFIFGIYRRYKIKASLFWKFGDMSGDEIAVMKERQKQQEKIEGKRFYSGAWKSSLHWIGKKVCNIYDTTQDVPEYIPAGFSHHELGCIDPEHDHKNPKAPNYCGFKKVSHEYI